MQITFCLSNIQIPKINIKGKAVQGFKDVFEITPFFNETLLCSLLKVY